MTYTELSEHIYSDSDGIDARVAVLDVDTRSAWSVLRVLSGRRGFDWWFDELEEELQDEIFEELVRALAKEKQS